MKVGDAFDYLVQEEESRLIDMDQVNRTATERVESNGIIFSMRSTRSRAARAATAPTFRARACSATFCPSSRNHGEHALRHGPH